jgi:hypothetical protein
MAKGSLRLPHSHENHQLTDAVLRRRIQLSRQPGSWKCPDAAIMAAYYDGAMEKRERGVWEQHFADCAGCQQRLAALARSSSEQRDIGDSGISFAHQWLWRAAPIAMLATAGVAAFMILKPHGLQQEQLAIHSSLQVAGPASPQKAARNRPVPSPATTVMQYAGGHVLAPREAGIPQLPMSASMKATNQQVAGENLEEPARLARGIGTVGVSALQPPLLVHSADRASLWQIGPDTNIRRYSIGQGWEEQDSGARFPLLAGSAPSKSVCWVVGRSGTILKTINGSKWQTLNSPTSADLVAVTATSALDATVTDANGGRFVTSDGGLSWRAQ